MEDSERIEKMNNTIAVLTQLMNEALQNSMTAQTEGRFDDAHNFISDWHEYKDKVDDLRKQIADLTQK